MLRRLLLLSVVMLSGLAVRPARANEQVITAYDAKSVGMGLTGTAWQNNSAAPYFNAANLGAIKRFDAVLAIGPNVSRLKSPYLGTANGGLAILNARSQPVISPLMMAGVGFRLHRMLAVGLAGGVTQVSGMRYQNVPASLTEPRISGTTAGNAVGNATAFGLVWDARATVALNLARWISVGGGYRIGFSHQQAVFEVDGNKLSQTYLNGQRYVGGFAGISLKPHRLVRVGLGWTSPFNIATSGSSLNRAGRAAIADRTTLAPMQANAGIAVQTSNHRLTLAADARYLFYKEATKDLSATNADQKASSQDAVSGHVGAEFFVTPRVPLRAGFLVAKSRTPSAAAFAMRFPPGMVYGGTVGAGVRLPGVDLDLGVGYGGSNSKLGAEVAPVPGTYGIEAWLLQASANVRL